MNAKVQGWFVTGTDTGVGKTCVAEALLNALARRNERAVGMKPIASGCRLTAQGLRNEDAERLARAASVAADYGDINPYAFEPAIAPHLAAAQAGQEMRLETVQQHFARLTTLANWIVVEGAGGWCVPINSTAALSDVARSLGLPVLLVVGVRLGCINHALLTARAIRADGLELAGWVANCIDPTVQAVPEIVATLDERLAAPRVALIPHQPGDAWREHGAVILARLLAPAS
jgi:dethiobiotin synthetase